MRWKNLILVFAFVAVLFFVGLIVGYSIGRSVNASVHLGLAPFLLDPTSDFNKEFADNPFIQSVVSELRNWKFRGRIGPFVVFANAETDGYMIAEKNGQGTTIIQESTNGLTRLPILGR